MRLELTPPWEVPSTSPQPLSQQQVLGRHISTQFWVYQCLTESWIIKHIFTSCVALCWLLLSSVLCGGGRGVFVE